MKAPRMKIFGVKNSWRCIHGQHAEQDHHHDKFNQGEATLAAASPCMFILTYAANLHNKFTTN
jgi:hypothetical protein